MKVVKDVNIPDSETVKLIAVKTYGLKPISEPKLLRGGTESRAWVIETKTGKWIVKLYLSYEGTITEIEEEIKLYDYLNSNSINAPSVLVSVNGNKVETLKIGKKKIPVIVMRHEDLRTALPSTITKKEVGIIAKETAKFHILLQSYEGVEKLSANTNTDNSSDYRGESNYKPTFPVLLDSPNSRVYTKRELRTAKKTDTRIIEYLNGTSINGPLTESLIHGDLALEHAPFLPNGKVYFFDWTDRGWAPVVKEIATTLVHLFREDDISIERWEILRDWFIDSYCKTNPLTEIEIATIYKFVLERIWVEAKYLNELSNKLKVDYDGEGVKRRYKLGKYILDNLL